MAGVHGCVQVNWPAPPLYEGTLVPWNKGIPEYPRNTQDFALAHGPHCTITTLSCNKTYYRSRDLNTEHSERSKSVTKQISRSLTGHQGCFHRGANNILSLL